MNAEVFLPLKKLQRVWLDKNGCINDDFSDQSTLVKVVKEKCQFCEERENETQEILVNRTLKSGEVACESLKDEVRHDEFGCQRTCLMNKATVINSDDFTIVIENSDNHISILTFNENEKIYFLPNHVDEIFPNLLLYFANFCKIREISRTNFVGLKKLRWLFLKKNFIQRIEADTFKDLESLEYLALGE